MARLDLGGAVLELTLQVKGVRPVNWVWHIGRPVKTSPEDRVPSPPPYHQFTGKVDVIMDLPADMETTLSPEFTDEVNNPVPTPPGAVINYTVDDPTLINLTVSPDGTAVAAATGTLGTANVHGEAVWNGHSVTGDLQIVVVAGLAERMSIVASPPREITPDVVA